jgi:hypothetical protein
MQQSAAATMKGAATPQGRQRLRGKEGSGGAATKAEQRRDDEGSGGATTKAEPAARRRRQRRPDEDGSGGVTTKAETVA